MNVINALSRIGDGKEFNEKIYKKAYRNIDKFNTGLVSKKQALAINQEYFKINSKLKEKRINTIYTSGTNSKVQSGVSSLKL